MDFLDVLLYQGQLGYDKLEQYVALKSHKPGKIRGRRTEEAQEEEKIPSGFRRAVKSLTNFLKQHPAAVIVPMAVIAMMGAASGVAHGAVPDQTGGIPGSLDHVGMDNHQPLAFDHVIALGSDSQDVTKIGSQLIGYVDASDVQNLAGQVNPITGMTYDSFLSLRSHKIVQGVPKRPFKRGSSTGMLNA